MSQVLTMIAIYLNEVAKRIRHSPERKAGRSPVPLTWLGESLALYTNILSGGNQEETQVLAVSNGAKFFWIANNDDIDSDVQAEFLAYMGIGDFDSLVEHVRLNTPKLFMTVTNKGNLHPSIGSKDKAALLLLDLWNRTCFAPGDDFFSQPASEQRRRELLSEKHANAVKSKVVKGVSISHVAYTLTNPARTAGHSESSSSSSSSSSSTRSGLRINYLLPDSTPAMKKFGFVKGKYESVSPDSIFHAEQRLVAALGTLPAIELIGNVVEVAGKKDACIICSRVLERVRMALKDYNCTFRYSNSTVSTIRRKIIGKQKGEVEMLAELPPAYFPPPSARPRSPLVNVAAASLPPTLSTSAIPELIASFLSRF